jgi:Glycosyltransferase family 87
MYDFARRYGPWIGLVIAAISYFPRFSKDPTGVTSYPQAAECLLNHQALPVAFTYPPFFAFVMLPFVPLPIWARDVVWYGVTWGSLIIAWWGSECLVRKLYPGHWTDWDLAALRTTAGVLSLKFILAVFENQAYDLLAFAFIILGLCGFAYGRPKLGGLGLAFAAAIKATPLIFLPWLILRRRYLAALVFVVAVTVFSFLPDLFFAPNSAAHGYLLTWLRNIAGPSLSNAESPNNWPFWAGTYHLNHSLRGAVGRLINDQGDPASFKIVLYSVWAVFAAGLAALLLKSKPTEEYTGIDGSLLLIAMLMLSPMTSRSHYVILLLPFMMLAAVAVKDRAERFVTAVLILSFVLTTASSNDLVGQRVTDWAYFYSLMPIGTLVLMVGLGAVILSAKRSRLERVGKLS